MNIRAVPQLLAFAFVMSSAISFAFVNLAILVSLKYERFDIPNSRSLHLRPVPRLGGLGILAGFVLSIVTVHAVHAAAFGNASSSPSIFVLAMATALILGTLGLYDDLHTLRPIQKFSIQLLFALIIASYIVRSREYNAGGHSAWLLAIIIAFLVLWLVAFTNFYNFMDGINGMAGGSGVIYGCFLSYLAWEQAQLPIAMIATIAAGTSLGFLFRNFPLAQVFMGDSGSLFLGMLFALLAVLLYVRIRSAGIVIGVAMLYAVFLYDCTITLIRRLKNSEKIFRAHHSHIYQRLVKRGWSHVHVTSLYMALQIWDGIAGVIYFRGHALGRGIAVVMVVASLVALTLLVQHVEKDQPILPTATGSWLDSRTIGGRA